MVLFLGQQSAILPPLYLCIQQWVYKVVATHNDFATRFSFIAIGSTCNVTFSVSASPQFPSVAAKDADELRDRGIMYHLQLGA